MSVTISFIVPTLKRPEFLRQCLASIATQSVPCSKVLVGVRSDDKESAEVVRACADILPVEAITAHGVGVIGSMSSCLRQAETDVIALVDDDVELPPHWLKTMMSHLEGESKPLAAGGRDFLQDHPEMRRTEARLQDVGKIHWYGRITGNHHRGAGLPRKVNVLRGSNCLFRSDFLRAVGFEQELRGQGAQVNWELALAFQALERGACFFYDPQVEVIHHVAPRSDADVLHRGGWDAAATADCAFNETMVVRKHLRGLRRLACLSYQAMIGSALTPGLFHAAKHFCRRDILLSERIATTWSGRIAALLHRPSSQGLPNIENTALQST